MIDFDILFVLYSCILLIICLCLLKFYGKKDNIYLLFFSIFYVYLIYVIKYTVFPIPIGKEIRSIMRQNTTLFSGISLIPFYHGFLRKELFLNIIMAIPFGFGISYITKTNTIRILLYSLLFGTICEVNQFIISVFIGFPYRNSDIDDIISNFIGSILGYIIFLLFTIIIRKLINFLKIERSPFINYIYNKGQNEYYSNKIYENIGNN